MNLIVEEKDEIFLTYAHPVSNEQLKSRRYKVTELIDKSGEELQEETCHCMCEPIGETNVVECNCEDYYCEFQLIKTEVEK